MDKCNAKNLLVSKKLKVTKQRQLILERIIGRQGIFTVNSLYTKLEDEIDLVTIYRVISIFEEKGIIREVLSNYEEKRYELACIHNPVHPHFNCSVCNELFCLEAVSDNLIKLLQENISDYLVKDISIQFKGICKKCLENNLT
ncbi:MAG: transcriptional repressor [Spirochaetales bacterium]|nr:transcriptional repressor [Spirochaetales bacterium]